MIELEKTYLLKNIPFDIDQYPYKELIDHYIPFDSEHPKLRLRKRWEFYEITKKTLIHEGDSSQQQEQTIELSKAEYQALADLPNKLIHKKRYYVPYKEIMLEIDVFQGDLDGLILMDVEFTDKKVMNGFEKPNFCLADVTQNSLFAGWMLCWKTFASLYSLIKQYKGEL